MADRELGAIVRAGAVEHSAGSEIILASSYAGACPFDSSSR